MDDVHDLVLAMFTLVSAVMLVAGELSDHPEATTPPSVNISLFKPWQAVIGECELY
jgi:hypothetical protein